MRAFKASLREMNSNAFPLLHFRGLRRQLITPPVEAAELGRGLLVSDP
jgi:hypothetical protein